MVMVMFVSLFPCRQMKHFFHHLLACLCLADLCFLICNILVSPLAFGILHPLIICLHPIAECGSHIMLSISIFLTVSITIERYQVFIIIFTFNGLNIVILAGCLLCPPLQLQDSKNRLAVSDGCLCLALCASWPCAQYSTHSGAFSFGTGSGANRSISGVFSGLSGKI